MMMAISRWLYLKEAFFNIWNYSILAALIALGYYFRHPYFYLFALGIEGSVLYKISSNPRFQRAIKAKYSGFLPVVDQDENQRIRKLLNQEHQSQLTKFETIYQQIRQTVENLNSPSSSIWELGLSKLEFLLGTYSRMLYFHQKYNEHLSQVDRDRIKQQIQTIDRELINRTGRIAELKQKNKEILSQRLEKIEKAKENREVIEAELEVMFNTINLLKDQTISMGDPQGISEQIDTVLANMEDTEVLIKEMDSLMTSELWQPIPNNSHDDIEPSNRRMERE